MTSTRFTYGVHFSKFAKDYETDEDACLKKEFDLVASDPPYSVYIYQNDDNAEYSVFLSEEITHMAKRFEEPMKPGAHDYVSFSSSRLSNGVGLFFNEPRRTKKIAGKIVYDHYLRGNRRKV